MPRHTHIPSKTRFGSVAGRRFAICGLMVLLLLPSTAFGLSIIGPADIERRQYAQLMLDLNYLEQPSGQWPLAISVDEHRKLWQIGHDIETPYWLRQAAKRTYRTSQAYGTYFATISFHEDRLEENLQLGHLIDQRKRDVGLSALLENNDTSLRFALTSYRDQENDLSISGSWYMHSSGSGKWLTGAGYFDRWWGYGWSMTALISNAARPFPSVFAQYQNTPTEDDNAFWRFLGPVSAHFFVTRLEGDRAVPKPWVFGARLAARPWKNFTVGVQRVTMVGGAGRSTSLSTLWEAFRSGRSGGTDDPANSIAGFDLRWHRVLGLNKVLSIYANIIGEDEVGYLPSAIFGTFGIDLGWIRNTGTDRLFLEFADTTAGNIGGTTAYNIAYEHYIYRSGWRRDGVPIGAAIDSDSRALVLGGIHQQRLSSRQAITVSWALADIVFNADGTSRNSHNVLVPISERLESTLLATKVGWTYRNIKLELLSQSWGNNSQSFPYRDNSRLILGYTAGF